MNLFRCFSSYDHSTAEIEAPKTALKPNPKTIHNPYTGEIAKREDFKVQTKETEWFERQIETCQMQGINTEDMERVLKTCHDYNKALLERKKQEDLFEKERRKGEWCAAP